MRETEPCMYVHGKIFTSNDDQLYADTMIVEDGVIQWIGQKEQAPCGKYKKVDLLGACVIPGFIDAHMHPLMLADYSQQISALPPQVHSIEELIEKIKERSQESQNGEWIEGWGYDEGKFAERRAINRYDLDRGCSDAPVSITRTCEHVRCVNSKALQLAGIHRETKDPEGGEIERDASGEPTGILKESARNLVTPWMPKEKPEDKIEKLVKLSRLLSSQGITAICDMGNLEPGDNLPIFQEAAKKGWRQKTAVYDMWEFFMDDPDFDISKDDMNHEKQIFFAGLKIIGDGSVSGRTAWMERPYLGDKGECGMPVCTAAQVESAIKFCKEHQCQLSIHAMGTKAIKKAVDRVCLEESWTSGDIPYVRIEHVTEPTGESVEKAAEKGIGIVTQPIFMYAEVESYLRNLGRERMVHCYPVKDMLNQGVRICFSTDAPATSWAVPSNPFSNLKAAVTRKTYDGTDCGEEQAVDIETAVKLYTREAAKIAGFQKIGILKKGYKADFAVLDRDIFKIPSEELDQTEVIAAYMDGTCIYCRKSLE